MGIAILDLRTNESAWIEGYAAGPARLETPMHALQYFAMTPSDFGLATLSRMTIDRNPLRLAKPLSLGAHVLPMFPIALDLQDRKTFFPALNMNLPFVDKPEDSESLHGCFYQYDTETRELKALTREDGDIVESMTASLSPDRQKLVYVNRDGLIMIQNTEGTIVAQFAGKSVPSSLLVLMPRWVDNQTICFAIEPARADHAFDLALANVDDPSAQPINWTKDWDDDACMKFLNPRPARNPPLEIQRSH